MQLAGDVGGAASSEYLLAERLLFLCENDVLTFHGRAGGVFEVAVAAAPVGVEIIRREQPTIYHAQPANTPTFDEVHEVPIRHLEI